MVTMMRNLEFRVEKANSLIIEQNKEWQEVIFFSQGTYAIGFEINHELHFPMVIEASKKF